MSIIQQFNFQSQQDDWPCYEEDISFRRRESEYLLDPEEDDEFEVVEPTEKAYDSYFCPETGEYLWDCNSPEDYEHYLLVNLKMPAWKVKLLTYLGRKSFYISDEWEEIKEKIINRDRCCINCHSHYDLQVHHLTYERFGGNERLEDLITLCRNCHQKVHSGEIPKYQVRPSNNPCDTQGQ